MRRFLSTGHHRLLLIFRPQKKYGEEKLWTIRPYGYLVARHIVWSIVIRGTSWRRNQRRANSLVSPQESRDSDSGILRQVLHSLAEMWSLMRSQCCRHQRRKVNRRVEIQLVQQILEQREWGFWRLLIHQGRISEQVETFMMRLLRCNKDR